ncbi:MAG: hypothetical protein ACRC3B_12295 [Bacteroidia bacterium]
MRLIGYSFLTLFILAGCSSEPSPKKEIVSQFTGIVPRVMDNDEGIFHGIELGMTADEVKKKALPGDSLSAATESNYLFFEAKIDSAAEYTYECSFDAKGLSTLTLMIYQKKETSAAQLFTDFKNYFTKKYGNPFDAGFGYIWEIPAGKRPAKITLREESDEYLYGVVSVEFYDRSFEPRPVSSDSLVIR